MAVAVTILELLGLVTIALTIDAMLWFWGHPTVRVMHGLEHATVKLLENQHAISGHGWADSEGFAIEPVGGRLKPSVVAGIARHAIERVAAGDRELAYDPRCGTVRAVGISLALIAAGAVATLGDLLDAPPAATLAAAIVLAAAAAMARFRLGMFAQRAITVSTELGAATVLDAYFEGNKVRVDIRARRRRRA